jgi:hypothetical protein
MSCSLGDESCYPINAAGELAREMGLEKGAGVDCGRGGLGPFYSRGFALFAVLSGTAGDCRCYNDLILPRASANHGNTELIDTEQF